MMSLTPPFTIMQNGKILASISSNSGDYILMDRKQFDDLVTEYLKLRGAE